MLTEHTRSPSSCIFQQFHGVRLFADANASSALCTGQLISPTAAHHHSRLCRYYIHSPCGTLQPTTASAVTTPGECLYLLSCVLKRVRFEDSRAQSPPNSARASTLEKREDENSDSALQPAQPRTGYMMAFVFDVALTLRSTISAFSVPSAQEHHSLRVVIHCVHSSG